ncbi:hypothetical protein [Tumebacillus permanentifrigoris]|uniref:Uncharacterized protein n=1 Tax=Tumebacillus permanentifrigoris TaxID=378543 RepID=A0A316D6P2_9BACL|nr:hypothetical protein [Tumebacillus permanentifrigoris]PWK07890.1 hypothetical protein C7459_11649 [Tumebacillus permanentifrigoris]
MTGDVLRNMFIWARKSNTDANDWRSMLYFILLIFLTDCVIWYQSGSLSDYDWMYLVQYSLMSFPLWTLVSIKGVGKEQVDLMEMSRWHVVDLLPGGATPIFLGHYLGKLAKLWLFHLWLIILVVLAVAHGAPIYIIPIMLLNIVIGAVNLILFGVFTRYYSPRGYRDIINSIVRSTSTLLSGALFPIGILTKNSVLSLILNPFSTVVTSPILAILGDPNMSENRMIHMQLIMFMSSIIWLFLFLLIAIRAERTRRYAIYS